MFEAPKTIRHSVVITKVRFTSQRREELLNLASYFWMEKGDIDRCSSATDIYSAFPELKKAVRNAQKAERKVTKLLDKLIGELE